jgi:prephenate dehydrogenase
VERLGTVAIIGVGLIGGSIGRALRARGLAERVIGIGRDQARLDKAKHLGAIDITATDVAQGVKSADVAVVCTPVSRVAADLCAAALAGPSAMLLTDAGSTKQTIVDAVERDERGRTMYVGAHPIAGSERQGAAHARDDLFDGRACVLTPTQNTPPDRVGRARGFWSGLGCRIVEASPEEHDKALALTSHLPHVVAAALTATVPAEMLPLTAGAYRDGTRVASSDAGLWTAIFLQNRDALLHALDTYQTQINDFRLLLTTRDADALREWWESFKARRDLLRESDSSPIAQNTANDLESET